MADRVEETKDVLRGGSTTTTTTPARPPVGGGSAAEAQLAQTAAQYGIDLGTLGVESPFITPQDFAPTEAVNVRRRPATGVFGPGVPAPGGIGPAVPPPAGAREPFHRRQVRTLSAALFSDEKLAEELGFGLADLQQRLYLGGFYGAAPVERVNFGVPDALTQAAFAELIDLSLRVKKAGSDLSMLDLLDQSVKAGILAGRGLGDGGATTVQVPGPAEIAQTVKATVRDLLGGREPTADELAEMADLLTGFTREAAGQQQAASAAPDGSQVVVDDPVARFREHLEAKYGSEIGFNTDQAALVENRESLLQSLLGLDQLIGTPEAL